MSTCRVFAQDTRNQQKISLSGEMGITYEYYGLDKSPETPVPDFYAPRKPWNYFRYLFNPVISTNKWLIPFNISFSPTQNNFLTPPTGRRQNLWEFLTNPANNFGVSPKIGTTEILLGTQTLKYSDLSTGDIGVFGYGVNLSPGRFRFKIFNGVSQRGVNYVSPLNFPPNGITGAYKRNQWMAQVGVGKEGVYFAGFNFVRSSDVISSVSSPPLPPVEPQQNMIVSFLTTASTANGWNFNAELGQSFHTLNLNDPLSVTPLADFKPFIKSHTSTVKDNAVMLGIDKKKKEWEIGAKFNYIGAGYYTAGYPFMGTDRMEYLLNTHFNAWKKKLNVVGSVGQRFGNISHLSGPQITTQIVANVNVFAQFSDHFTLNTSFNNYGFNAPGTSAYKSVSNELSLNPVYTWANSKMSNMLSGTYTQSRYDETIFPAPVTHNDTKTVLLLYVPSFFNSKLNPDFSLMWFHNKTQLIELRLWNFSGDVIWNLTKVFNLKGQLQYALSATSPFTSDKNLLTTVGFNWQLYKKLSWQFSATANLYRYGSELPGSSLTPVYPGEPQYLESSVRTGLNYRF
ncbi:MAG TPA: hypothetical protein VHA56_17970 [Mucilaginibacter sp.]|nr:hypothetical protein [Mucilaginibacter sp.]